MPKINLDQFKTLLFLILETAVIKVHHDSSMLLKSDLLEGSCKIKSTQFDDPVAKLDSNFEKVLAIFGHGHNPVDWQRIDISFVSFQKHAGTGL